MAGEIENLPERILTRRIGHDKDGFAGAEKTDRLDARGGQVSTSFRHDENGDLGWYVGAPEAADGDQTKVATVDKATGQLVLEQSLADETTPDTNDQKLSTPADVVRRAARAISEQVYPTRSELLTRSLPAVQIRVRTSGHSVPGVGGAEYVLVASEPAHAGKFPTPDGRWWELAESDPTIEMFGALRDGVTDIAPALAAAFSYGASVTFGPFNYSLETPVSVTRDGLRLKGFGLAGAGGTKIKVATGSSDGLTLSGSHPLLDNIHFSGDEMTGGSMVVLSEVPGAVFNRVRFSNGYNGLLLSGTNNCAVRDCYFADNRGEFAIRWVGTEDYKSDVLNLENTIFSHRDNEEIAAISWGERAHSMSVLNCRAIFGGRAIQAKVSDGVAVTDATRPSFLQMDHFECEQQKYDCIDLVNLHEGWVDNFWVYRSLSGSGVVLGTDTNNIRMRGGRISGCWKNGIINAGRFNSFVQNRVYANSASNYGDYSGILVKSTSYSTIIALNTSGYNLTGLATQKYGLEIESGATFPLYVDNALQGNLSGTVSSEHSIRYEVGGGAQHLFSNNVGTHFVAGGSTPSSVNYVRIAGGASGTGPAILAEGTDTHVNLRLLPKGDGKLQYGDLVTAGGLTITGYIEIRDRLGTIRRLAVVA